MNIAKHGAKIVTVCAFGTVAFCSFAGTPAKAQDDVVVVRHHHYWRRQPGVVLTTLAPSLGARL